MKVFYTASFFGKDKYQHQYDLVKRTLESFSIELIGTEVGNYKDLLPQRLKSKLTSDQKLLHYEAIRYGISASEAVVIECSREDFQLGHEASLAIQSKKPVLCLSIHEDISKRVRHEYLFGSKYDEKNIGGTVQDFLAKVREMSKAERFNMFLYKHQLSYIKAAAEREGLNMSEYVRKLINEDKQMRS